MTGDADAGFQHILIIDDDERLRLLLRRFLEESDFRVTDVGSALKAGQMTICRNRSSPASLYCASGQSLRVQRRAPAGTTAALHSALTVLIAAPVF